MRPWIFPLAAALAAAVTADAARPGSGTKPNIIFILTDDQDRVLGSMDFQPVLRRELIAKGTQFTNHYCTTAICCPSRASILRGQFAHNHNITHVLAPGGNYDKWVIAGEDKDYLAHWLRKAGYRTEYVGKFLNGYSVRNYDTVPQGWDHIDALIDPYTYWLNTAVFSENGNTPVLFPGYHQTDVIRAKSLARLEHLTSEEKPFFLTIAPAACHVDTVTRTPMPQLRHWNMFPDAAAPRGPNYNPPDEFQSQKSSWIKKLKPMTPDNMSYVDMLFRTRIRSLQGVDEIIEDVVNLLEKKGVLNNTYIVYSSDNGYHLGQNRIQAGKSLPYVEDTNLPFIVRGPGVPAHVTSDIPSTHVDLAPTFLKLAGLNPADYPPFLDGRSLVEQWHHPEMGYDDEGDGADREIVNVEFWGTNTIEAPSDPGNHENSTYKTLRFAGRRFSYLFVKWCTGETELYDTLIDPYELTNLANSTDQYTRRLIDRLNAVLMVTKSCSGDTCRSPWHALQLNNGSRRGAVNSLRQAMDDAHDGFFASFDKVHFETCMSYQDMANEAPFYPPDSASLGTKYRNRTDFYGLRPLGGTRSIPNQGYDTGLYGGASQRNTTLADLMRVARNLTDEMLGKTPSSATPNVTPSASQSATSSTSMRASASTSTSTSTNIETEYGTEYM